MYLSLCGTYLSRVVADGCRKLSENRWFKRSACARLLLRVRPGGESRPKLDVYTLQLLDRLRQERGNSKLGAETRRSLQDGYSGSFVPRKADSSLPSAASAARLPAGITSERVQGVCVTFGPSSTSPRPSIRGKQTVLSPHEACKQQCCVALRIAVRVRRRA